MKTRTINIDDYKEGFVEGGYEKFIVMLEQLAKENPTGLVPVMEGGKLHSYLCFDPKQMAEMRGISGPCSSWHDIIQLPKHRSIDDDWKS
jgi:hypothetical protein